MTKISFHLPKRISLPNVRQDTFPTRMSERTLVRKPLDADAGGNKAVVLDVGCWIELAYSKFMPFRVGGTAPSAAVRCAVSSIILTEFEFDLTRSAT